MTEPTFVSICCPANMVELAFVRSLLEAAGIRHSVPNEHFAAVSSPGAFTGDAAVEILVERDRAEQARMLLRDRGVKL
ncbi:MAG TPA: DUF2007 domain-containing protein [Polyangia bacterium]|jgi:hypothetical protein